MNGKTVPNLSPASDLPPETKPFLQQPAATDTCLPRPKRLAYPAGSPRNQASRAVTTPAANVPVVFKSRSVESATIQTPPESDVRTGAGARSQLQGPATSAILFIKQRASISALEAKKASDAGKPDKMQPGLITGCFQCIEKSLVFNTLVIVVIMINLVVMMMDPQHRSKSLWTLMDFFTVFFTVEIIIRLLSRRMRFFKNGWNVLDLLIVITMWPEVLLRDHIGLSAIRALRVLRPLRTVTRLWSLQVVLQSMLASIIGLSQVAILLFFIFVLYGIVGMQLFAGDLRMKCFDANGTMTDPDHLCTVGSPNSTYYACKAGEACLDSGQNPLMWSFDNIMQASLTIMQCATLEGWTDVMYMLFESHGYLIPVAYFVTLVFMISWFALELVTGVVYDSYQTTIAEARALRRENTFHERSSQAMKTVRNFFGKALVHPMSSSQLTLGEDDDDDGPPKKVSTLTRVVQSQFFKIGVAGAIFLNTVIMTIEHHNQPDWITDFLYASNLFFEILFTLEIIAKASVYGLRRYLSQILNVMDLIIVIMCWFEFALESVGVHTSTGVTALRALRLFRLFKITSKFSGTARVVKAVARSFYAMSAIVGLNFILTFVFAMIGMQLFAGSLADENGVPLRQNFDSLPWAFINVFMITGGENWNEHMFQAVEGTSSWATLYYIVVLLLGKFMILNLFFSILLQEFHQASVHDAAVKERQARKQHESFAFERRQSGLTRTFDHFSVFHLPPYRTLFLFKRKSKFRLWCAKLVFHRHFHAVVFVTIAVSTVALGFESPGNPTPMALLVIDYVATGVFAMEIFLRLVTQGGFMHPDSYLREPFHILNVLIVLSSVLTWATSDQSVAWIKAFRSIGTLKTLRFVKRFESVKVVAAALVGSLYAVASVLAIQCLVYVILGVIGMNFFSGNFYQCETVTGVVMAFDKIDCVGDGLQWKNPDSGNFDDIFRSLLVLFEMSTMEMWPQVMIRGVDVAGTDLAPERDANLGSSIYFIVCIVLGNFFFFSLLSGAVVEAFITTQNNIRGEFMITAEQLTWKYYTRLSTSMRLKVVYFPPSSRCRQCVYRLVTHDKFETMIMSCILLNTIVMASYVHGWSGNAYLEVMNQLFFCFFFLEAVVKLIGLGWQYFGENWNRFDFSIVVLGVLGLVVELAGLYVVDFSVLRAARAARLVRVVRQAKVLNGIFSGAAATLPVISNVFFFSFLLAFVYAVVGMSLFGTLPRRDFLNEHANFEHLFGSFQVLFRCATGENWNGIMHDCMVQPCPDNKGDFCGSMMAVPYFISFVVLFQLIVVSLLVGIAMQGLDMTAGRANIANVEKPLREFHYNWTHLSPRLPWYDYIKPSFNSLRRNNLLELKRFEALLARLKRPDLKNGAERISRRQLDIPIWVIREKPRQYGVKYTITVLMLVAGSLDDPDEEDPERDPFLTHTNPLVRDLHKAIANELEDHLPCMTMKGLAAVHTIEKAYLLHKMQHKPAKPRPKTQQKMQDVTPRKPPPPPKGILKPSIIPESTSSTSSAPPKKQVRFADGV